MSRRFALAPERAELVQDAEQEDRMPKVDPATNQPVSDEPEQASDEARGGKEKGDPALKGASETGGANPSEDKQK